MERIGWFEWSGAPRPQRRAAVSRHQANSTFLSPAPREEKWIGWLASLPAFSFFSSLLVFIGQQEFAFFNQRRRATQLQFFFSLKDKERKEELVG